MNVDVFWGNNFPLIDLGEIVLREIRESDAEDYLDYMYRPEMLEYITADNVPTNMEQAVEEMQYWGGLFPGKRSIYWGIALKETDQLIGTIGFNIISFPNARADISYDLNPDFWGKGVMLSAMKAVLRFADNNLRLVRIQATVVMHNKRSTKLLERCGFVQETILKKYEILDGEHKDYYLYARVR